MPYLSFCDYVAHSYASNVKKMKTPGLYKRPKN